MGVYLFITRTDIKDLLNLALKNSYFQFNGKFYKQKIGLTMGNTLSPILADIYMDDYQQQHLHQVNSPNKIWRYVDDVLIITIMNQVMENSLKQILLKHDYKILEKTQDDHDKEEDLNKLKNMLLKLKLSIKIN
ncbi:unnamed protein product [Didymodactylos carnosus]|uniref:Reverse transcriptase domain-containing protein n=1 Tax=Didymodactylos carnosus TaxID=1234261 RepID=A0A815Z4W8_9BILA|nr:unnamed protein product [Didymodactylos carnosus]CAF1578196.1 unnamed protein product [Didymodactylos carnosus]CAF4180832.1 unnamed protein product [Didymodactylos carnosus]CAF4444600.1 unnamed protein product [Didymodactylos carnosus]